MLGLGLGLDSSTASLVRVRVRVTVTVRVRVRARVRVRLLDGEPLRAHGVDPHRAWLVEVRVQGRAKGSECMVEGWGQS